MHAVGPPNLHGVLKFQRPPLEHCTQSLQIAEQNLRGLLQLQRLRGIDDIVRGEAIMQPARRFSVPGPRHSLRHGCGESDNIVLHFGFDLKDARDIEAGVFAKQPRCLRGHDAHFRKRLRCR
jgi:hypothetical protein